MTSFLHVTPGFRVVRERRDKSLASLVVEEVTEQHLVAGGERFERTNGLEVSGEARLVGWGWTRE